MCLRHKHQPEPCPVYVSHCSLKERKQNAHGKGTVVVQDPPPTASSMLHVVEKAAPSEGLVIYMNLLSKGNAFLPYLACLVCQG